MVNAILEVKADLRVSHCELDDVYKSSINECLADMKVKGIIAPNIYDPNILAAIKLYCRSLHGDPEYSEQYMQRYEQMRDGLVMAEGYGWKVSENE